MNEYYNRKSRHESGVLMAVSLFAMIAVLISNFLDLTSIVILTLVLVSIFSKKIIDHLFSDIT